MKLYYFLIKKNEPVIKSYDYYFEGIMYLEIWLSDELSNACLLLPTTIKHEPILF